jgi:hypothetical protein
MSNNPTGGLPTSPTYTAADLRNMEAILLKKLDKFNTEYSNYMKYLYNMRHNVAGDTSPQFKHPNNSPITTSDFSDLNVNQPVGLSAIYIDLSNTLQEFINMLNYMNNHPKPPAAKSANELQSYDAMIVKMRKDLDRKLFELNEIENSFAKDSRQHVDANVLINVMWTAFATSLVYYIVVHS